MTAGKVFLPLVLDSFSISWGIVAQQLANQFQCFRNLLKTKIQNRSKLSISYLSDMQTRDTREVVEFKNISKAAGDAELSELLFWKAEVN